jgi:hypothetical protein
LISGAASAALTAYGPHFDSGAANTAVAAISGGTVAEVSGGKFANGAALGAISYLVASSSDGQNLKQSRNTNVAPGSDDRPDLAALANDPTVKSEIDAAWSASNPNGPGPKAEHGFWIQQDWFGRTSVVPFDNAGTTRDQMVPGDTPGRFAGGFWSAFRGNQTVAFFHTHPNTAAEGYESGPSRADVNFARGRGVPGIIQSHDGVYYFGPQ